MPFRSWANIACDKNFSIYSHRESLLGRGGSCAAPFFRVIFHIRIALRMINLYNSILGGGVMVPFWSFLGRQSFSEQISGDEVCSLGVRRRYRLYRGCYFGSGQSATMSPSPIELDSSCMMAAW